MRTRFLNIKNGSILDRLELGTIGHSNINICADSNEVDLLIDMLEIDSSVNMNLVQISTNCFFADTLSLDNVIACNIIFSEEANCQSGHDINILPKFLTIARKMSRGSYFTRHLHLPSMN